MVLKHQIQKFLTITIILQLLLSFIAPGVARGRGAILSARAQAGRRGTSSTRSRNYPVGQYSIFSLRHSGQ